MRHYRDTCTITGGRTAYPSVPCTFSMMDQVKAEALFGGAVQVVVGTLYVPLYVNVPEEGRELEKYRVILFSPYHPRINQPMTIDSIRWMRLHQVLTVGIPGVT